MAAWACAATAVRSSMDANSSARPYLKSEPGHLKSTATFPVIIAPASSITFTSLKGPVRPLTHEVSDAGIAQPKPGPRQASDREGENRIEPWSLNADLARDGAAKVPRHQDGSELCGTGKDVQKRADQRYRANSHSV